MVKQIFSLFLLFILISTNGKPHPTEKITPGQQEMFDLLKSWCDGLLNYQVTHTDSAINGGIVCPGCAFMHGRAPDAIYPLLYMAAHTNDQRYADAARKLFSWGDHNVRFPDGSWNNEVSIYTWRGITVFGLITLLESIQDFGYLLDEKTRSEWLRTAEEQVLFVSKYMKPGFGNINYPASACYALALTDKVTGKNLYSRQAEQLALEIMNYFTDNDSFFFGEGPYPYVKSAKGLLPVDLGYNVEETLPNLLHYAELSGNSRLKEKIITSMRSHIEFMLGDGAWDNSWGTRNFKWSYWGSRTCDGVISMCPVLSKADKVFGEAGYRNFELLKSCTDNGLLYGGIHYRSAGYPACIHHTFEHAKGLAMALHKGFSKPEKRLSLPREKEYGVRHFRDLDVWTISIGEWRATVTGYDVPYKSPGGNAHGGALSLLWNRKTGPVLAAAMTEYSMVESSNMQISKRLMNYSSTFRIEYKEDGKTYTNICSKKSDIQHQKSSGAERLTVQTELVSKDGNSPPSGPLPVTIVYSFSKDELTARITPASAGKEMTLSIPVISGGNETYHNCKDGFYIEKPSARLYVLSDSDLKIMPTEVNRRAFNPVPGFEFIPFYVSFRADAMIRISVRSAD